MTGTRLFTAAIVVSTTASNSRSSRYADSPVLPNGAMAWAPSSTSRDTSSASRSMSTVSSGRNGVTG
ncbi:Uncharacterised protein [Mycobacteroides abscessus]|nr:Uncharacterised protein [Mycobacteroides abscessus]